MAAGAEQGKSELDQIEKARAELFGVDSVVTLDDFEVGCLPDRLFTNTGSMLHRAGKQRLLGIRCWSHQGPVAPLRQCANEREWHS